MNSKEDRSMLNLRKVKVWPLAERKSLSRIETLLHDPAGEAPPVPDAIKQHVEACAERIRRRPAGASVMLIYGAHLIKNGAHKLVQALVQGGHVTHLATNGAGGIHDWELSYLGRTEESVRANVAQGQFGTWDETGRHIHTALLAGALRGEGYGTSLGRFISEDGCVLPEGKSLEKDISADPAAELTPAKAELLQAFTVHGLKGGRVHVPHPHKAHSILGHACSRKVPATIHAGIGYDIITNHPMFNGAVIGRASGLDFRVFAESVEKLDGGVVLSVGSAIMGPQVFEKSLSCVNNLRLQSGRPVVRDHSIFVVDIQDGGNWDWNLGEPPKTNPAYYLRFCKSYARMGGAMHYVQCDNVAFLHHLLKCLSR